MADYINKNKAIDAMKEDRAKKKKVYRRI